MSIKAILFDLDGTLLPMDLKTFQMTSGGLFIVNSSRGFH